MPAKKPETEMPGDKLFIAGLVLAGIVTLGVTGVAVWAVIVLVLHFAG